MAAVETATFNLTPTQLVRVTKRLNTAIGYYELGMTEQAIRAIDSLDELGDVGPFRVAAEVVRFEALRQQQHLADATRTLEAAARLLPAPYDQSVWLALSICFQQAGDSQRAANSLGCARGAKPPANSAAG